jgi:hypothetical protein
LWAETRKRMRSDLRAWAMSRLTPVAAPAFL